MITADWLLDLEIDGAVYRYAVDDCVVLDADGIELRYRGGLSSPRALERGVTTVELSVLDRSVDWPTLARRLRRATLRRWEFGQTIEEAAVWTSGEIRGVSHGDQFDPVSFAVTSPSGEESRGQPFPDPLARHTEDTWGALAAVDAVDLEDLGSPYPIVFGEPGKDETNAGEPAVPTFCLSRSDDGTYIFVSEGHIEASEVWVHELERFDAVDDLTVSKGFDDLGRRITYAFAGPATVTHLDNNGDKHRYFLAFREGAGLTGNAWETIEYMLSRWARGAVDWRRMRQVAGDLAQYQIDSYVSQPVKDPWAWISSWVRDLPYEVLRGDRGFYLRRQRWLPAGRPSGEWTEGRDAIRISDRSLLEGDVNEYSARYRPGQQQGVWLARHTVTSEGGPRGRPAEVRGWKGSTVEVDGRCSRSYARYGFAPAKTVDLDWTWSQSTAVAVLRDLVERDAVDRWQTTYALRGGSRLELGDEIYISDPDLGVDQQLAVVGSSPTSDRTDYATVTLWYAA